MLKAEDLKVGTILEYQTSSGKRRILHISGPIYFLSAVDDYEAAGNFFTLYELNYMNLLLADETAMPEPKVGQVWENLTGERILIHTIDDDPQFAIEAIVIYGKNVLWNGCYARHEFRNGSLFLSPNQSREIILKDEA